MYVLAIQSLTISKLYILFCVTTTLFSPPLNVLNKKRRLLQLTFSVVGVGVNWSASALASVLTFTQFNKGRCIVISRILSINLPFGHYNVNFSCILLKCALY